MPINNNEINEQIKKIIDKQGFMLINIQGQEGEENVVSFTIGLYQNYQLPELIFVNEDPDSVMKLISKIIDNKKIGIELDETIQFTNIDGHKAKIGSVPDLAKEAFTPQIMSYYAENDNSLCNYPLKWIGKFNVAYPFEKFMDMQIGEDGPVAIQ